MTLAQKFSSVLNEIDDKFVVEAIEYQHHKVRLPRGKSLLLIAVLIVGLTATVMAAHLLGIGDLLLFPKQHEGGEYTQEEVIPEPDMIGLSGYMNTPEGQALSEWSAFLNQYDPDGAIASSLGNAIDESLQRYSGYTVYTQEMLDELEHIANEHSLKLHTEVYDLTIHPELLEPCSGYLGGTDGVATYMFDDGSFHVDGSANISSMEVLYQLQRCAKGSLNEVSLNVINAMSYQEWQYQTSRGISATLALGSDRALILADLPDSFVTITVLAGSTDGLTRDLLEEMADSFDLSKLTPIALPESLYTSSP